MANGPPKNAQAKTWFGVKSFFLSKLSSQPACSCHSKACGNFRRNRTCPDLHWIGRIAFRPDPCFLAFHRKSTLHAELVADVKARTAKFADPRCLLDRVAEACRPDELCAGIDQRNAHDAVCCRKVVRLYAERCLEQRPGAPVEIFKETRIEDDSRRVAMTPFND